MSGAGVVVLKMLLAERPRPDGIPRAKFMSARSETNTPKTAEAHRRVNQPETGFLKRSNRRHQG
jgi:hypothetical protein